MAGRFFCLTVSMASLAAAIGCGSGSPPCAGAACDVAPGTNACKKDSDCAGGTCRPDGTCSDPYTPTNAPNACANMQCSAGFFCANGQCLSSAAQCKAADPACIFVPRGAFEPPVHAWWWPWMTPDGPDDQTGNAKLRPDIEYTDFIQVMSTPVVMRLHPGDPAPAVVFNSFWKGGGTLEAQGVMRAINGVDGSPIWSAPKDFYHHQQFSVDGNASIAAGDCLGTGEVCFVTGGFDPDDEPPRVPANQAHRHGGLIAFGSDGRFLWKNPDVQVWWGGPAIARLLGPTGPAQIVVGDGVYDGATGKTLCRQTAIHASGNGVGSLSIVADVDMDGKPEILIGNNAYRLQPDPKSATGYSCPALYGEGVRTPGRSCAGGSGEFCGDGFTAVADLSGYGGPWAFTPGFPQVVVVSNGSLRIQDWTGGMLFGPVALPPADPNCAPLANLGGPPVIADFDGDGLPEIGVASQSSYAVFKPGKGFIWRQTTRDCSASTGSSVFDFEGKGEAKVVYGDECFTRIFDGKTGTPLMEEKNPSCTAFEMPVVADVDGTGRAKILVPANTVCDALLPCPWGVNPMYQGLKALASPSDKWVNTRSVWNEHAYHVTNVNTDGTLPWPEPNSWAKGQSNSYRQNVQGAGVFSSPDLTACEVKPVMTDCAIGKATVEVTVYNGGASPAKPGVRVAVYADGSGGGALIGTGMTKTQLAPGQSETVTIPWPAPPQRNPATLRAVVDPDSLVGDCHRENNVTNSQPLICPVIG